MATINIANLTFSHKGNYDGSTAYVKNDVVYYATNGNAYIAKQNTTGNAPTNGTYWSQFAAGSGGIWNAGLSLGTAGQVVKVNSGASALEFGTVSSDYVKIITATGGGTSAFAIDNCFSATYRNYLVIGNIYTSSNTNAYLRIQNSSNTEQSNNYFYSGTQTYRNSSTGGHDAKTGWNQNEISMQENIAAETEGFGQYIIWINQPYIDNTYTNFSIHFHSYDSSSFRTVRMGATHRADQINAGFRWFVTSGNITSSSKATVYGLKE